MSKPSTRDELRSKIFSTAVSASKRFTFFGVEIELRQPSMGSVMEAQQSMADDRPRAAAMMVVRYAYVPGTDERLFEETDIESILAMPFGKDLGDLNKAIAELTNIDILGEEGNSPDTQGSTTATS